MGMMWEISRDLTDSMLMRHNERNRGKKKMGKKEESE